MITSAEVWMPDKTSYVYACDQVVFEPHGGFLKLLINGETHALFAALSWTHVVINRGE